MEDPEKLAFCAPGMEIPARFALIEHARDVGDAVAEIRQTQFVKPDQVIVMDVAAMKRAFDDIGPFEYAPPPRPVPLEYRIGFMVNRPMPLIGLTGC